jgi:hypothetical protein
VTDSNPLVVSVGLHTSRTDIASLFPESRKVSRLPQRTIPIIVAVPWS